MLQPIVEKYVESNYPNVHLSANFVSNCWNEIDPYGPTIGQYQPVLSWLLNQQRVETKQYSAAKLIYDFVPRWTTGYVLFAGEERKKPGAEEDMYVVGSAWFAQCISDKWRYLDETMRKVHMDKANEENKASIYQLKEWITTMDKVEIEFKEWPYSWANPDMVSTTLVHDDEHHNPIVSIYDDGSDIDIDEHQDDDDDESASNVSRSDCSDDDDTT